MNMPRVQGLARRLGVAWKTLWRAMKLRLPGLADDSARFERVSSLGVGEHLWHHVDSRKRGPKELTGVVDLSRDANGKVRARLLDLVPGRSKKAYLDWLTARGKDFRAGVKVAALYPFAGYKGAIDDHLQDATAVLDAFHVVVLGTKALDEVRRRIQIQTLGRGGHKADSLYGIQRLLRLGRRT